MLPRRLRCVWFTLGDARRRSGEQPFLGWSWWRTCEGARGLARGGERDKTTVVVHVCV